MSIGPKQNTINVYYFFKPKVSYNNLLGGKKKGDYLHHPGAYGTFKLGLL